MKTRRFEPIVLAGVIACQLVLVLTPAPGVAGVTGKLAGRALDKTGKPVAGVNVAVPAARTGAITDEQGRFVIVNLPSGTYEVKANLLGYRGLTVQDVSISADNTTSLDLVLEEAPVAMQEVVVSAKRPVVDIKLTSNLATLHRQEIQQLPVQEIQDIVNLQAGVVDGHVRGGRIGEVQYQVDGVSVNDAYDNKSSLRLDRSLLEEVQVVTGTFDAEYGQAMSGVVNAVLRRGSDKFQWGGEAFVGDFAFPSDGSRIIENAFHPTRVQNYQFDFSGPTPLSRTTYLLNARGYRFDDYVDTDRRFTPWRAPTTLDKIFNPDGDGDQSPLGYSHEVSGVFKLSNRSIPHVEVNYQAIGNLVEARKNNYDFRLDPDGLSHQRTRSVVHGFDLTHTLSRSTFYNLSLRQNYADYRDMVYEDAFDTRYDLAGAPSYYPGYEADANVMGVELTRFTRKTNAVLVKGAFTSQFSHDQQIKLGAEFQWPHLEFGKPQELIYTQVPGSGSVGVVRFLNDIPQWRPYIASGFAQEELEWNDLRLRAGLRFDYFNPRASLPSDLSNPANAIAGAPPSTLVPTTRKWSLSPRIGVSYPVTARSALFFAYGHFYQMPELGQVFDNADYSILTPESPKLTDPAKHEVMGNPDIRPQKTVQYQFGYKQSITDDLGIDLTIFYKDIRDLLGTEFISTYNDQEYARLANTDFGSARGFTVTVTRRSGPFLSTTLNYTWQLAQGNSSDPRETVTRADAGEDPRPRTVPFDWDQRHTVNLTVTAARPDVFNASVILRTASGQPYTPKTDYSATTSLEENSGRKPNVLVVDLRGERRLRFLGVGTSAFARVFNLFDTRFDNGFVFDTSGSPYYSRFPTVDYATLADPTRYFGPRRIELGFSVRSGG